ncbi:hypothetical protein B7463_g9246, partial [Scytalidium lignicola]
MSSYLITGASRGFGLELVKHLSSYPSTTIRKIFAAARGSSPTAPLAEIIKNSNNRVHFIELDVTDEESIIAAVGEVEKLLGSQEGLDVLINNAAIQGDSAAISEMKIAELEETISVNLFGVHRVSSLFLPQLAKSQEKKIVNISSTLGSIELGTQSPNGRFTSYKISKAALNMLTIQYAYELGPKGFTVFALSPGWLQTDLGGERAHLKPADGARATLDIILHTQQNRDNGSFRDIYIEGSDIYTGQNPVW